MERWQGAVGESAGRESAGDRKHGDGDEALVVLGHGPVCGHRAESGQAASGVGAGRVSAEAQDALNPLPEVAADGAVAARRVREWGVLTCQRRGGCDRALLLRR